MGEWRFDEAEAGISEASAWLVERDELIADAAAAGLVPPDRLRDRYVVAGGGSEASSELDAERAVVDAYGAMQERVLAPRGPMEAVGLFLADAPTRSLAEAADSFGQGDLHAAVAALDRLDVQLNRASSDGVVRLATVVVLAALLGLGVSVALRRRSGSHYTAAP